MGCFSNNSITIGTNCTALTFISSHIQTANAYGVCFSQLVRYSRACDFYHGVLHRGLLLTNERVLKVQLVPMMMLLFEKHPIHVFKVQQLYPLLYYLVIGGMNQQLSLL
jgi:hypothetical protein